MTETKMRLITKPAEAAAVRRAPAADACRWSEAHQTIAESNLRIAFAFQRMWIRLLVGG
jgi:hypothetical protein